jgi:subtilisin-like proprotein convertase family protein
MMNTKLILIAGLAAGLALQLCPKAVASPITITGGASPGQVITDEDLNGLSSTITLSAPSSEITSVSLTLDIAGAPIAYNGDYYAYLQFGSGLIVLLNSIDSSIVPFGSPGSGINVTLIDGNPNIGTAPYSAGQPLTGTYSPQGGGASTGSSLGNTFDGMNPNGSWTLFIADESPGGVGELVDWSLDVTANTTSSVGVPDNGSTWALLVLGGLGMAVFARCSRRFAG